MTFFDLAFRLVLGAVAGAVAGLIGGGTGAFLEGYFTHPLVRFVDHRAQVWIAMANVSGGSMLGGLAGALTGAVTAGFGTLAVPLTMAAALGVAAYLTLRRVSGEPIIGAVGGALGGASSGATIAYVGLALLRGV